MPRRAASERSDSPPGLRLTLDGFAGMELGVAPAPTWNRRWARLGDTPSIATMGCHQRGPSHPTVTGALPSASDTLRTCIWPLALHPARGQATDYPLLAVEEHRGDRQAGEHGGGGEVAPQVVLLVEVLLGTDRQGQFVHIHQQHRGDRVFGDAGDKGEDKHHGQDRYAHRQEDMHEGLPGGRTVDDGGLFQRGVDALEVALDGPDMQGHAAERGDYHRAVAVHPEPAGVLAELVEQGV